MVEYIGYPSSKNGVLLQGGQSIEDLIFKIGFYLALPSTQAGVRGGRSTRTQVPEALN